MNSKLTQNALKKRPKTCLSLSLFTAQFLFILSHHADNLLFTDMDTIIKSHLSSSRSSSGPGLYQQCIQRALNFVVFKYVKSVLKSYGTKIGFSGSLFPNQKRTAVMSCIYFSFKQPKNCYHYFEMFALVFQVEPNETNNFTI